MNMPGGIGGKAYTASVADEPSTSESEPHGRSEWERFEAFAKRLVAVPKAEVDALRKREKRRRARA